MADIPFPFPFAQLLECLLVTLTTIVPLYTALFTGDLFITPLLTFCVTLAFWSLLEISKELENPFADGPNQLPVIDGHERFVELIRTVYHTRTPDADSDSDAAGSEADAGPEQSERFPSATSARSERWPSDSAHTERGPSASSRNGCQDFVI